VTFSPRFLNVKFPTNFRVFPLFPDSVANPRRVPGPPSSQPFPLLPHATPLPVCGFLYLRKERAGGGQSSLKKPDRQHEQIYSRPPLPARVMVPDYYWMTDGPNLQHLEALRDAAAGPVPADRVVPQQAEEGEREGGGPPKDRRLRRVFAAETLLLPCSLALIDSGDSMRREQMLRNSAVRAHFLPRHGEDAVGV